jgi:hypothetical protein
MTPDAQQLFLANRLEWTLRTIIANARNGAYVPNYVRDLQLFLDENPAQARRLSASLHRILTIDGLFQHHQMTYLGTDKD